MYNSQHNLYHLWEGIKRRCYNPNAKNYRYYGGSGITMNENWKNNPQDFISYIVDNIGEKPDSSYSLDRIDGNRGYEPGNVKWSSPLEQKLNQRPQGGSSKYRGVRWKANRNKWFSAIQVNKKHIFLGSFDDEKEAYLTYRNAFKYYHGKFPPYEDLYEEEFASGE